MPKTVSQSSKIVRAAIIGVLALILLIILAGFFASVKSGHMGVITTFGKVEETALPAGLHFKFPIVQDLVQMDTRTQKAEVSCSSASKDLQTVSSTIAVNYRLQEASATSVYKNIGLDYETKVISPAIQECVKAVTAKFTAEELITNRQVVGDTMQALLAEKITPYGFEIQIFNITNFEFSAEFNAAIEAKQTAQQNALKASQDLQRIKIEAEQQIAQAKAEAESYKLKTTEITNEIILMTYLEKWDGKLPAVISSGEGSSMLLDISEMMKNSVSTNTTPKAAIPEPEPAENTDE